MKRFYITALGIIVAVICLSSCKVGQQRRTVDTYVDVTICPSEKGKMSTRAFDW